jgi:small-conductance mechanosensitive channel
MEWLAEVLAISRPTIAKWLITIGTLAGLLFVRWIWLRVLAHRAQDMGRHYRWRKAITYSLAFVGLVIIGTTWLEGVKSVVTYLGLVSAGIAIALRDPIMNWFGWIYTGWRRPFVVGDRVALGGLKGDIIDIGISTFSLLEVKYLEEGEQVSGRIIQVPNGKLFSEPLINYTQGFDLVWNEVQVTVSFESDWRLAKSILLDIAHEHADEEAALGAERLRNATKRFFIREDGTEPAVYTRLSPSGVQFTLRYPCGTRRRRSTEQAIAESVLERFASEESVEFAYNTTRIFRRTEERKGLPGGEASPS